jgi:hypothetical protein
VSSAAQLSALFFCYWHEVAAGAPAADLRLICAALRCSALRCSAAVHCGH